MLEQRLIIPEQQKFVVKLMGFEFDIVYRPSRQNTVAGTLSRKGTTPTLTAIIGPIWEIWEKIRETSSTNPDVALKRQQIEEQNDVALDYEWREGLLFYLGKIFVPNVNLLRTELISGFHDSRYGGHSGIFRTWNRMANTFIWLGMK